MHVIASSNDIGMSLRRFKSFTAKEILKYLKAKNVKTILEQLAFYKKAHKKKAEYQLWQEGLQPKLIQNDKMMRGWNKLYPPKPRKKRICG